MVTTTAKCRICGRLYVICSHIARDQSVCAPCEEAAKRAALRPDTEEQRRRRREAFGQ